jgi:simple sugar transport system permease protein
MIARLKRSLDSSYLAPAITVSLFALVFGIGSVSYNGFFSLQVLLNLLIDNAFLLVVAIGMTFVILSGGIDLSVGSVVALTTMLSAYLVQEMHWNPVLVVSLVLLLGTALGAGMGALIHFFKLQPFIVTLAGMFFARGLCYVISINAITITDPLYTAFAQTQIPVFGAFVSPSVIIALAMMALAVYLAHYTRFGRTVYAIGGNEQSALLMGLPVGRVKVMVYAFSGFCAAMGGVLFSFYMLSGYGLHASGTELDAIAAVVIGGTLLTGGVGYVFGTMFGVLILGIIQTLITFDGSLSSWWTKIVIGTLLLIFCVAQRLLSIAAQANK